MTALRDWCAPERTFNPQPSELLLNGLGNRVIALSEELRAVQDENTSLRTLLDATTEEVVRLTRLMLERSER